VLQKMITIDPQKCTGCRQCAMICSFKHEGVFSMTLSRIKLVSFEDICLTVPVTCAYCEEPICEKVCPVGAMTHDPETGMAKVIEELCIGCKECLNACPIGAIDIHPNKKVPIRCDLCGGDPQCVANCERGALKYETVSMAARAKRRTRIINLKLDSESAVKA
jgi:carbon-monoxide dehydrogenase iron sulfur subunit